MWYSIEIQDDEGFYVCGVQDAGTNKATVIKQAEEMLLDPMYTGSRSPRYAMVTNEDAEVVWDYDI